MQLMFFAFCSNFPFFVFFFLTFVESTCENARDIFRKILSTECSNNRPACDHNRFFISMLRDISITCISYETPHVRIFCVVT